MKDIKGIEIKIGQEVVVPFGKNELQFGIVTRITKKKVKVETLIPESFDSDEAEDAWWEAHDDQVIDGTWYPEAICIIKH